MIIRLEDTLEEQWKQIEAIYLGPSALHIRHHIPDAYGLLEGPEGPLLRFDLHAGEWNSPFKNAVIWKEWVVIGFSCFVHFYSLRSKQTFSYPLHWYFGHLYLTDEAVLVASATELWCFASGDKLRWQTQNLGVDGVLIQDIKDGIIRGEGEWDPPGGWLPFTLALETGKPCEETGV